MDIKKEKNMGMVYTPGRMAQNTREIGMKIVFTAKAFILGTMADNIMENGKIITWTVTASTLGKTAENTKVNILKIKSME